MLESLKIYECDIKCILSGANVQSGNPDLFEHGHVVISSLDILPSTADARYIHWQRCKGKRDYQSTFGLEGTGTDGSLGGMGPVGEEVTAAKDDAVIFVEIEYAYQPLISDTFVGDPVIRITATFNVRDDRDLSHIYQRNAVSHDPVAQCNIYDGMSSE